LVPVADADEIGFPAQPPQLLQLALQNLAHERGVGFALAQFHHLTFEKIQRGGLAGLGPTVFRSQIE